MAGFSVTNEVFQTIVEARQSAQRLLLFRGALDDEIGVAFLALLEAMTAEPAAGSTGREAVLGAYGRLFALLADEAEFYAEPLVGDAWQNHLLDRVLNDDNPFSRKAQRRSVAEFGPALLEAARDDLRHLQPLFRLDARLLAGYVASIDELGAGRLTAWDGLSPLSRVAHRERPAQVRFKQALAAADDWGRLVEDLAEHYHAAGAGLFGRYHAFRWIHVDGTGRLEGVSSPDPVTLEELVGYEVERRAIIRNTEYFLGGFPANNVLLYGDRGTGKSSTVKALLNAYAERGLRLIEVPKQRLSDFPLILSLIRDRPEHFILFVDDLSFDEHETSYKDLKAILEGSLEARPANVAVYATSNRRHLVQERLSDRPSFAADEELHARDAVEEKLSFSDRFGITTIFSTPDQERYLFIVASLAKQRALPISVEELRGRAIRWAAWQNGRSCRSAHQFIDYLTGELGVHWPPE
jgi:uncharacterized protein